MLPRLKPWDSWAQAARTPAGTLGLLPSLPAGTPPDSSAPPPGPKRTGCRFLAALRSRSKTKPQQWHRSSRSDNSMRGLAFIPQLPHVWAVSRAGSTTTSLPAFFAPVQRGEERAPPNVSYRAVEPGLGGTSSFGRHVLDLEVLDRCPDHRLRAVGCTLAPGPVVQLGVHAGLSSRRSRVQIPSGPLGGCRSRTADRQRSESCVVG